jgi:glycosyltransferase involved in cell wall biosynthesis
MKTKAPISVVIIAKNEEKNLTSALKSVDFCQDVIVVDNGSSDDTRKIAVDRSARVIKASHINDFSKLRNLGLQQAKFEWVLFLDADETIGEELKKEIINALSQTSIVGFQIGRIDNFLGKNLLFGETASIKLLRLAKRGKGEWSRAVHENWLIRGKIGTLKNKLMHNPHQSIEEFIDKINHYTELEMSEWRSENRNLTLIKLFFFPSLKFIDNYFIKLGFLDGMPGFILAYLMSFHSFCVRAKLLIK